MKKAKSSYEDTLAAASARKKLSDVRSASRNETLAGAGLLRSGYADYLKGAGTDAFKAEEGAARRELYEAEANAYSGYAEYINNYEALQNTLSNSYFDSLITDGIFDAEEAEARAIASGISKDKVKSTAELGVLISRKHAVSNAIKYAKSKNYTYTGARYYALSLGLSEKDAERVASSVGRITPEEAERYESLDKEAYFDEIKNSKN